MYNSSRINIIKSTDSNAKTLLESVKNHLNLESSQLFFPIFQHLDTTLGDEDNLSSDMYRDKIFNSKYKCTQILGVVDDDYDVSDGVESLSSALRYNYNDSDIIDDSYKQDGNELELDTDDGDSNWTSEDEDDGIMTRNFEPNISETMIRHGIIDEIMAASDRKSVNSNANANDNTHDSDGEEPTDDKKADIADFIAGVSSDNQPDDESAPAEFESNIQEQDSNYEPEDLNQNDGDEDNEDDIDIDAI